MPIKCVMVMRIASGKISNRRILIRWNCHPIGISFEIKLRDHLVFGHNDSGGDYLYSYNKGVLLYYVKRDELKSKNAIFCEIHFN